MSAICVCGGGLTVRARSAAGRWRTVEPRKGPESTIFEAKSTCKALFVNRRVFTTYELNKYFEK